MNYVAADEREHLGGARVARGAVGRFEVEPQQRFGVARPQVEPPVAEVDGETVEAVLLGVARRRAATCSMTASGSSTRVLISPDIA